jgi:hypothetical protein
MTAPAGVRADMSYATSLTMMSRSQTVPITRPSSSHTGSQPMSASRILAATLSMLSRSEAYSTSVVITSSHRIRGPLLVMIDSERTRRPAMGVPGADAQVAPASLHANFCG